MPSSSETHPERRFRSLLLQWLSGRRRVAPSLTPSSVTHYSESIIISARTPIMRAVKRRVNWLVRLIIRSESTF